ncbi:hypothetical protein CDD80_6837 [Ophiocordyceps camponoti-rufipedis]|uniref:Uncharacterized protein n=1 Tax=Ophiocordyceps camponoti-rufipedis TaxID=2004952 RepID=A0A2C5YIG5_9HYPO|nr:hypothetical protein CDD80_6837 [Ophiocordyceps camponoti-rufipedis]
MKELIMLGLAALSHGAASEPVESTSGLMAEKTAFPADWAIQQIDGDEKCLRALTRELHSMRGGVDMCRYFLGEGHDDADGVAAKALQSITDCDRNSAARACRKLERGKRVESCVEKIKTELSKKPDRAWELCREAVEIDEEREAGEVVDLMSVKDEAVEVLDLDEPLPRDESVEGEQAVDKRAEQRVPDDCYEDKDIIAQACRSIGAPESLGMPGCRGTKSYDDTIQLFTLSGLKRLCRIFDQGEQLTESMLGKKASAEVLENVEASCRCHQLMQSRAFDWLSRSAVEERPPRTTITSPVFASRTLDVGVPAATSTVGWVGDEGGEMGDDEVEEEMGDEGDKGERGDWGVKGERGDGEVKGGREEDEREDEEVKDEREEEEFKDEREEEDELDEFEEADEVVEEGWNSALVNASVEVVSEHGSGVHPGEEEVDVVFAGSGRVVAASKLLAGALGVVLLLN